jgi:hypothetical protein
VRESGNIYALFAPMTHSCHYLCSEIVTVTFEDQPGEIRQMIANLEEIASDKAVLLVDEPPSLGAPISLAVQGRDLFGTVRARLHDAALGWFAIISLDAASEWCHDWFAPKHLLPVCGCSQEASTNSKARYLESTRNTEENVPVNFVVSEA